MRKDVRKHRLISDMKLSASPRASIYTLTFMVLMLPKAPQFAYSYIPSQYRHRIYCLCHRYSQASSPVHNRRPSRPKKCGDSRLLAGKTHVTGDTADKAKIETLDFTLAEHKPLGCTVEESLAAEPDGISRPVFIAKVAESGNAARAGLQVGDVIIALTGVFGDLQDISADGIEKVRALVSGKHGDEPMSIRVLRGSDVIARHEEALVELCLLPDGTDETLEKCLDTLFKTEYTDSDSAIECGEDDSECLVDSLYQMWGEELVDDKMKTIKSVEDGVNGDTKQNSQEKKKPAPWSSRSSPSGTYVRNPRTGKLENIDQ